MRLTRASLIVGIALSCFAGCAGAPTEQKADTLTFLDEGPPRELRDACRSGLGPACFELARFYQVNTRAPDDLMKASILMERACEFQLPAACLEVANAKFGMGHTAPAARFYESACELGAAEGCLKAGLILRDGTSTVATDRRRAEELFRHGCSLQDGEASAACCAEVGDRKPETL